MGFKYRWGRWVVLEHCTPLAWSHHLSWLLAPRVPFLHLPWGRAPPALHIRGCPVPCSLSTTSVDSPLSLGCDPSMSPISTGPSGLRGASGSKLLQLTCTARQGHCAGLPRAQSSTWCPHVAPAGRSGSSEGRPGLCGWCKQKTSRAAEPSVPGPGGPPRPAQAL